MAEAEQTQSEESGLMKLTWKSPAWSVQHHLAERALALWFASGMQAILDDDDIVSDRAVQKMKWQVYWWLLDLRNVLLDRERA